MLLKKKKNFKVNFLLIGLSILIAYSISLGVPKVYAATFYNPVYANSTPAQYEGAEECPDLSRCNVGTECANSENKNNCRLDRCGPGSNAWTKYQVNNCYLTDIDEEGNILCDQLYLKSDIVYSIGDKCTSGGPYLDPGYCESAYGGPIYKTCCRYPSGGISPYACEPIADLDDAGDIEGKCPAGYEREVMCGPGYGVACGPSACGSVAPPPPPPGPTAPPVVNECPTPGAACGSCVTQSCNGVACASGHNYCVYSASGNYCGACQTEVNNCSTQTECISSPTLDSFSGVSSDGSISCYLAQYTASLSWTATTSLPASDAACANGFWVDIDSTGSDFSGGYYHKCVPSGKSTNAPEDFNGFNGISDSLTFNPGGTYHARVYNGQHSNTLPLAVPNSCGGPPPPPPPPDYPPICNSFIITDINGNQVSKVIKGTRVTINSSISDADSTRVSSSELFLDGTSDSSFNNGLNNEPFAQNIPYGTSAMSLGNHTFIMNAIDTAGNPMFGKDNACHTPLQIDAPQVAWVAPLCSVTTFSGCNLQNQPTCSDWGQSGYKTADGTDWTQAQWDACSRACTMYNSDGNQDPDLYCAPGDAGTINTPIDEIRSDNTSAWPAMDISIWLNPPGNTGNIFWRTGSCNTPSDCLVTASGWTRVTSLNGVATGSYSWTPPLGTADGDYTFGLMDKTNSKIYDLSKSAFQTGNPPPPPANGGPPPAPVGCSLTINNSPGTAALKTSQGSLTIQSTKPAAPMTISIDGPKTVSFGPYQTTEQTITVDTFGWPSGAYSLSNGCMSRTVNMGTIASCSSTYKDFNLSLYTFDDPDFDPNNWPQYSWDVKSSNVCWAGVTYGGAVQGASTGQVLAATSCWNDSDCNDNNACTQDICNGESWFNQGTCSYSNNTAYGTVCGNTANGGNMYCGGQPGYDTGDGICHSNYCKTNGDCNDGNACTDDTCQGYSNPQFGVETLGTCASYSNMPYATTCGQNSYCGGNAYTGAGDGICHANSCKTASDCNDNNACTTDTCNIISGETFGSCANSNLPPDTICQKDVNNNPTKLCSPGSEPGASTTITSTCSVDYIGCYSSSQTTGPSGNCCGLVNIQGNQCNYNSNCNRVNPFTSPHNVPPNPRLGGVVIHVDSNECGISQTVTTDNNGYALLTLPYAYGSAQDFTELEYRVWAEVPSGKIFTRGLKYNKISLVEVIPPPTQPEFDGVDSALDCSGNSCSGVSRTIDFGFKKLNNAWIQTTGGDVHSNIRINTPGGP